MIESVPPATETRSLQQAMEELRSYLQHEILGQDILIERMLIALLADGHLLVEGPPGLAKTRAIKTLARGLQGSFQRLQFTPDMLPSDLTGSDIYRPETSSFTFQRGPLFHQLILADEINRAPAKVQSALLEAMAERQISVGNATYPLPPMFMVMATQNPLEHEGTYPLPEAQLDRFMLHVLVDYPDRATLRLIMALARQEAMATHISAAMIQPLTAENMLAARQEVLGLTLVPSVEEYIAALIDATHRPAAYSSQLKSWLRWGASPRAALALERGARARAWLQHRDYVSPEDVQALLPDVLRHRLLLDYSAQAQGVTVADCINEILSRVPAP